MYTSYYANQNQKSTKYTSQIQTKSTSQYLFLNLIRIFSIIYLVITIFYIPIFLAISEINSLYWQGSEQNYSLNQKIFLQGTIFAIKTYDNCYQMKLKQQKQKVGEIMSNTNNSISFDQNEVQQQECFAKKLQFLPFIQTVEQFHLFYFCYFISCHFIFFVAVVISQYYNKRLYIDLEYPIFGKEKQFFSNEKLELKKVYHLQCQYESPIYLTKTLLIKKLKNILSQSRSMLSSNLLKTQEQIQIKNIKICLKKRFEKYAQLKLKIKQLHCKLQFEKQRYLQLTQEEQKTEKYRSINLLKDEYKFLQLDCTQLQIQLQKQNKNKSNHYHQNNIFIHFNSFHDCLMFQEYIFNLQSTNQNQTKSHEDQMPVEDKNKNKQFQSQNSSKDTIFNLKSNSQQSKRHFNNLLKLNFGNHRVQFSDFIVENIPNLQFSQPIVKLIHKKKKQFIQQPYRQKQKQKLEIAQEHYFHPNQKYKICLSIIKFIQVIIGIVICTIIILIVDIFILIIQKSQIFNYSTVFIVIIIQILLKTIIIAFSEFQKHLQYSHLHLSIMLKLTLFIFFNSTMIFFVAYHNLGDWKLGQIISTYQFTSINNQKWFLKIGILIIITVIIQIIYCNLRVYIEILKKILINFISKRISSLIKFQKAKQKLQSWINYERQNYKKPVMDIQISYSQILPIYLIGFTFSYLFPILFLLLFIFSITVYHTHKNYIELYTLKVQHNSSLLNDWAYFIIYCGLIGGIVLVGLFQEQYQIHLTIYVGLLVFIWIGKEYCLNQNNLIINRLKLLSRLEQSEKNNRNKIIFENQIVSDRKFIKQSQIKSFRSDLFELNEQCQQNQILASELKQKQMQFMLLDIFNNKNQHINEIHGQFYDLYKKILYEEFDFLKSLKAQLNSTN